MPLVSFTYGGFWDVPRYIFCRVNGIEILLQSEFDDELDDYDPDYHAYSLPARLEPGKQMSWTTYPLAEARYLGAIPVSAVEFDPSKRSQIEANPIIDLLNSQASSL